jgi:histidyl-tRNA synthetase
MGDVVLGELLKDRGVTPEATPSIDVFIAGITGDDLPHILATAHELRDANLRVEYALNVLALGKQLNLANARHARWAVLIGPDERARNEVMLRNLEDKSQVAVPRDQLVARLAGAN